MPHTEQLTDEQQTIIGRVEKLLRLAGGTSSEAESAAATAKAMELLAAYNLDAAMIGKGSADPRLNETITSGAYDYQRSLWTYIAELNFCMCWREKARRPLTEAERNQKWVRESANPWRTHVEYSVMRVVGRKVNVISTKLMADYLFAAIERLTTAYLTETQGPGGMAGKLKSRQAASFREGTVNSLSMRLWDRRNAIIAEQKAAADAARAAATRNGGADTTNALTLTALRDDEHAANMEFMYPGYADRVAARAAKLREAEEAEAALRAADPAYAAAKDAEQARENAKRAKQRGRAPKVKYVDAHAYGAGERAGKVINLDAQVDTTPNAPRIGT